MAYPPAYDRTFSFTDWEVANPGEPKPGSDLDSEFDAVSNALTATQDNLALIQRSDGALANDSVGEDQLQDGLLTGIVDGVTADAEAAAAAAAASAAAAAGSASAAATSATDAATQAGIAAGSAAAAGVSQGIAQGAATDASDAAAAADNSADVSVAAANSVVNSVSEAQLHEETAFKWAEYLAGPVMPAPPGWPEAVDDGMFSSKWWALRARDFNNVTEIDLGTGQPDIGQAFDDWDAIPGNDLPLGLVYATWGTPPLVYALTDPTDPSDPNSWTLISGGPGPAGPSNTLTIGTVVAGTPAAATITGASPNQVLSLTIPPGATGATGPTGPTGAAGAAGPPNILNAGTVTTGAPGSAAAVSITGTSPAQTINFTIPAGATGATGPAGPTNFADPSVQIGLTMVPGGTAFAARADSAPALSQAISPTWTGQHIFAPPTSKTLFRGPSGDFVASFQSQGAAGSAYGLELLAGANTTDENMRVQDRTGTKDFLKIRGDGRMAFGNTTDNPTFNFLGTGDASVGGNLIFRTGGGNRYLITEETAAGTGSLTFQAGGGSTSFGGGIVLYAGAHAANPGDVWIGRASGGGNIRVGSGGAGPGVEWARFTVAAGTPQLLLVAGSAAAPSYSFTSDPNTGIYSFGADTIGFATNGTARLAIDNNAAYFSDGTAAAPSITFLSDFNTGIYHFSPKVLGFTTNGVLRALLYSAALEMQTGVSVSLTDGTLAVPGLNFANDPDTGAYRIATNVGGLVAGGALSLFWDATSVGIADGSVTVPGLRFISNGNTGIFRNSTNGVAVASGGVINADFRNNGGITQLAGSDGALGFPYYTFNNDLDTGIYRFGTNTAGLVAGGAGVMLWNTASMIMLKSIYGIDGSAGAPAYSFDNDTNTGLYRIAGDVLGIACGGSETIRTSSGGSRISGTGVTLQLANYSAINTAYMEMYANAMGLSRSGYFGFVGDTVMRCINELGTQTSFGTATVDAAAFATTSARASKRETGAPSRPANILARLRPLMYRLLAGDDREQLGLIAEEVHEVCPQLSDGKTVAYDRLAILLLAAWQDEHLEAA